MLTSGAGVHGKTPRAQSLLEILMPPPPRRQHLLGAVLPDRHVAEFAIGAHR
jgi:hypothetical protein